jgi:hypothetical protein
VTGSAALKLMFGHRPSGTWPELERDRARARLGDRSIFAARAPGRSA